MSPPVRPKVAAFDIIGTTFSIEPLRPRLTLLDLPPAALDAWYAAGLRDAFALAATGGFEPFRQVLDGALEQVAAKMGVQTTSASREEVLEGLKELPPHPDAGEALETLAGAGIRVLAVSNGAAALTRHLFRQSGLDHFVERVISVEDVRRSKPAREVYDFAAREAGVEPGEVALVATHPWDIHGAKSAGWLGAYVARGVPYPSGVMRPPDIEGETLAEVTARLAALPR
jgi:2-haloacid dehalogenase